MHPKVQILFTCWMLWPGQSASSKGYASFLATCELCPGLKMCCPLRGFQQGLWHLVLHLQVWSGWHKGSGDTSASYIVSVSWSLPLLCPLLSSPSDLCTVVSSCLSLVCVLGTGRLPGHPSTKEKFSLPATANATLVGKQDYPACTSEAKADGGEHFGIQASLCCS